MKNRLVMKVCSKNRIDFGHIIVGHAFADWLRVPQHWYGIIARIFLLQLMQFSILIFCPLALMAKIPSVKTYYNLNSCLCLLAVFRRQAIISYFFFSFIYIHKFFGFYWNFIIFYFRIRNSLNFSYFNILYITT